MLPGSPLRRSTGVGAGTSRGTSPEEPSSRYYPICLWLTTCGKGGFWVCVGGRPGLSPEDLGWSPGVPEGSRGGTPMARV